MTVRDQPLHPRRGYSSRLSFGSTYFTMLPAYTLMQSSISLWVYPSVLPLHSTVCRWHGNINPLSITYAFRPRLRSRLTLSGRAFLRKPWAFGEGDSHPFYRYSCQHSHFRTVHCSFRYSFSPYATLSLPPTSYNVACRPAVSVVDFSPGTFSARSHSTSELLRTL